jgi:hypothetical protein
MLDWNSNYSALVAPPGIEPGSEAPETSILSIVPGSHFQSNAGVRAMTFYPVRSELIVIFKKTKRADRSRNVTAKI